MEPLVQISVLIKSVRCFPRVPSDKCKDSISNYVMTIPFYNLLNLFFTDILSLAGVYNEMLTASLNKQ